MKISYRLPDWKNLNHWIRLLKNPFDDGETRARKLWLIENLGEENWALTYYVVEVKNDDLYYFNNEADFLMFCLKFGERQSHDKSVDWR